MPQLGGESVASSTGCVECKAEGGEKQSRRGDGGWLNSLAVLIKAWTLLKTTFLTNLGKV